MYSENAVDVFDVNNMEWIQTIPLKKVSAFGSALAPPAGPDQLFIAASNRNDATISIRLLFTFLPPPLRCDL